MTDAVAGHGATQTCPWLGLADDPATHFAFPSSAQRCHAGDRPTLIDSAKQARDCLTAQHVACSRYRPPVVSSRHEHLPGAVPAAALEPVRAATAGTRTAPRRMPQLARGVLVFALLAILLIAAIGIGLMIGSWLGGQGSGAAPGPSTGTAPSMASDWAGPTATPAPTSTASPAPAPTSTASPLQTPTPTAKATPAPTQQVHTVRRGETLTSIALRYGVTVKALRRANGITDPNLIIVGQRLVIPAP